MKSVVDPTTSPVPLGTVTDDPSLRVGSLDPRDSAARALSDLLRMLVFRVSANGAGPDRIGKLIEVLPAFPVEAAPRKTPCASITDRGDPEMDDFEPEVDEETFDEDTETALVSQEVSGSFSVDVWATDEPERRALKAAIPVLFRTGDSRGGVSVLVEQDPEALPPAMRVHASRYRVRLTLDSWPQNVDDAISKSESEFRATFTVDWTAVHASVVDVARLDGIMHSGDVLEPGDLTGPTTDEEI
jgi:hypothetical protein